MLSFKLKKKNHDRLSEICLWLCGIGFLCLAVAIIYGSFARYLEARSILADYRVIEAAVELDHTTDSYHRRSGTRTTYHFRYYFEVDGTQYEDTFGVSESNIDRFRNVDSVEVAFANQSHEFARLSVLDGRDSLLGTLWDILWILFLAAILTLVIFVYLTAGLFVVREQDRQAQESPGEVDGADATSTTRA